MCLSTVETGKDGRPKVRGPVVAFKLFTGRLHGDPIAGRLYGPNYTYPVGGYVPGRWYKALRGIIRGTWRAVRGTIPGTWRPARVEYPAGYHALRDAPYSPHHPAFLDAYSRPDPKAVIAYGWRAVLLSGITATGKDDTVVLGGRGIVARRMRIFSKRDSLWLFKRDMERQARQARLERRPAR